MREAASMVAQQIEKSGFKGVLPGGVVLTGGGSRLPGTQRLFEEVLKFAPARIADSSLAGQCEGDKPISAALGMARFAIQCSDDLGPANGSNAWRERVKVLLSRFGART
jgi:cell division protein FtsA